MNIGVFKGIAVVLVLLVAFAFFPSLTQQVDAGADEVIRVTQHERYYDANGEFCSNRSHWIRVYTPVVHNGYGHYYNYHIEGQAGHLDGHGTIVTGRYSIYNNHTVPTCH